ncbi:BREX-2 system phosphatase PglZ [Streptomyces sp. NBC_01381]|uniref:BREX-2 system phosphatase PglZ n=1 Tax=Streptomyces sp. NBC_01381 TaxID=2903845 RepID=UPI002252C964|nr:BREX-2 system phosphatase PglZ [Streptomyces sp. NBC_01381]MCX4667978.1 BREX-2 system phosphatase PglZ [Streptomyces sp. NBC_01381]
MAVRPLVNRRIIEALLDTEMRRARDRRLLLVNARYDDSAPTDFTARVDGAQRRVHVSAEDSVLGIVDAWQRHLAAEDGDRLLVIASGVSVTQLGWDIRAHAVGRRSLGVDRAEIVKQLFGATDLDPRMYRETWLLDALLEAEPAQGWPRGGAVLTRDAAVRALVDERLSLSASEGQGPLDLDADALLAWSRTVAGPARFAELPEAERAGLTVWLTGIVGAAAPTLLALVADGRGQEAMALGVLGSVLSSPEAPAGATFALGGLFGATLRSSDDLPPFTDAVTGTLARWIAQAESNSALGAEARERVYAVLDRADELAVTAGLHQALRADPLLPSGMKTRLRDLAAALDGSVPDAENRLGQVLDHQLARLHPASCDAARMAIRLVRWLNEPTSAVESVAQAVSENVAQWGWVDRALAVLSAGDPIGDPVVGQAYHRLIALARARRGALDEQFGNRFAAWTRTAATASPGGVLLIEDVLAKLVVPLASQAPPLLLVLDGMSAAVAAQLSDEIDRRVWTEVVPKQSDSTARRLAAASMVPSVTTISRASLLSGQPTAGGQAVEASGFAAFWRRHRRAGVLFHKGQIGGAEGHRLAPELLEALAGESVVGVVLNTIDDALDHGQEGEQTTWRLRDISHLLDLFNAARGYGRPLVLVSDHGHVLDRSEPGQGPTDAPGAKRARWRTGQASDGEVELSGPRVLEGDGTIVAPWREDIRYTPRKAGYHGGASPAEVTVPVIVLVPSQDLKPASWTVLPSEQVVPPWWHTRVEARAVAEPLDEPVRKTSRRRLTTQDGEGLFAATEVAQEASTLGDRVVRSDRYKAQKAFVRRPPDAKAVAAVIDALAGVGGKLTPDAVAAAAAAATGRSQRNAEIFITVVQRLLNVEGYGVINLVEAGRIVELNVPLLKEQFGTEEP